MRQTAAYLVLVLSSTVVAPVALGQTVATIPIDSVRVAVRESGFHDLRKARTLSMQIETIKQFGCLRYTIEHEYSRRADTLEFELTRIVGPPDVCLTAFGPAELKRDLAIATGRYTVIIRDQSRQDLLKLHVTDSSFVLTATRVSFVRADERRWWRFYHRSILFYCGNAATARLVCDDVRRWLSSRAGVRELRLSSEGVNPYRPDPDNQPDEDAASFTYTDGRTPAAIQRCFSEIALAIRDAVGVRLIIGFANGDIFRASSKRAYHETHIAMPRRVTTGPGCSGAR